MTEKIESIDRDMENELVIGVGMGNRNTRFHAGVFRQGKQLSACTESGHAEQGEAWQCGLNQAADVQRREVQEGKERPRIVLTAAQRSRLVMPSGAVVEFEAKEAAR